MPAAEGVSERSAERSPSGALDDVERQLASIDSILGELLDVTRTGLADLRKETRPFDAWLRGRIAEEPTPPAIELDVAPEVGGLRIAFDPALLGRALHNVLVNARAHGHPASEALRVRLSRAGERLRIAVEDRGPGFAAGLADKAFEPFVRGEPSRARPPGAAGYGLGLAIVRRIVEAHGGGVFAENRVAPDSDRTHGATVGLDLPIEPAPR
jgi:signal transduction histidine kinase